MEPESNGDRPRRRMSLFMAAVSVVAGAFALFLIVLIINGRTWRAIAYATVALFGFLFVEAVYFWGTMVLGGLVGLVSHGRTPVPWVLGEGDTGDIPEHDLDPGLEILAAGILVYRLGGVRPLVCFREVSLKDAHAIRPFVVARTGVPRPHSFVFTLSDDLARERFSDDFTFDVHDRPRLVMPGCRLQIANPHRFAGQRWGLRVRSGKTVITVFNFSFVAGARVGESEESPGVGERRDRGSEALVSGSRGEWFDRVLDEALKQDVLRRTREVVLEEL